MPNPIPNLEPADLHTYLGILGWSVELTDERRVIWRHRSGSRVFVPARRLADFDQLVSLAISEIARAENRNEDDIFADLLWPAFDKLFVRHEASSSLGLDEAVDFHAALGDVVTASALAARERKATYAGRRPEQVLSYLSRVRIVPSMPGSFVARALLPLTALEGTPLPMIGPAEPAVRRVSTMILNATAAAVESAQAVASGGPMDLWDATVSKGVSANLCDALARLTGSEGTDPGNVGLRIDWAWSAPDEPAPAVTVPSGLAPILQVASDYLRGDPEQHSIQITGRITHLHRDALTGPGNVTVRGYIEQWDSSDRALKLELDEGTYHRAVTAHDDGTTVRVKALVRRAPRAIEVLHVEEFEV